MASTTTKTTRKTLGDKVLQEMPATSPVGRPSTLTQEKIEALAHHLREGNFAVTACALEGVAESTFYYWLEQAQRDVTEGRSSIYVEFLESIKKASAEAEAHHVKAALEGAIGWQAHMTFLERRFPDRWGHQSKLNLEEARVFVQKLMGALLQHIPDRAVLAKIVAEVRRIQVEHHEHPSAK